MHSLTQTDFINIFTFGARIQTRDLDQSFCVLESRMHRSGIGSWQLPLHYLPLTWLTFCISWLTHWSSLHKKLLIITTNRVTIENSYIEKGTYLQMLQLGIRF